MYQIKHLRQPPGSRLCGQTCVAMITGVSIDKVVEIIGHTRGTRIKELSKGLVKLGYLCDNKLKNLSKKKPILEQLPELAIVNSRWRSEHRKTPGGHWVVWCNARVYDPEFHFVDKVPQQSWLTNKTWRLTSFAEVKKIDLSKEAVRCVRKLLAGDFVDFSDRVVCELDAIGLDVQTERVRGEGRSRWMLNEPEFRSRAAVLGITE